VTETQKEKEGNVNKLTDQVRANRNRKIELEISARIRIETRWEAVRTLEILGQPRFDRGF